MFPHRPMLLASVALLAGCAGTIPPDSRPVGAADPGAKESPPPPRSKTLDLSAAEAELRPSTPTNPDDTGPAASGQVNSGGMQHDMPEMQPGGSSGTALPQPATTQAVVDYTCPMHPQVHQDHPGNCPICGMKLIKKDPGAAARKSEDQ